MLITNFRLEEDANLPKTSKPPQHKIGFGTQCPRDSNFIDNLPTMFWSKPLLGPLLKTYHKIYAAV